jgi:Na+-transporting NADH:ubiquinone oxidoreductase subunit B
MHQGTPVWVSTAGGTPVDSFTGETALAHAAAGNTDAMPSLFESFIGIIPGSIGETSTLAILIGGAIFLLVTGVGSWRVMLSVFVGGIAMSLIFKAFAANAFNGTLTLDAAVAWWICIWSGIYGH